MQTGTLFHFWDLINYKLSKFALTQQLTKFIWYFLRWGFTMITAKQIANLHEDDKTCVNIASAESTMSYSHGIWVWWSFGQQVIEQYSYCLFAWLEGPSYTGEHFESSMCRSYMLRVKNKITTSEWPVGKNIIGIHCTLKSRRECNIHSHFSWPFEGTVWEDVFSSAWLERSKYRSTTHFFIGDKKSITPKSASQIFTLSHTHRTILG